MSAACNAAEQAELEEGEIEDDGELLDEFPEIVITSPLHRHAHSRKRHQPSSANSTSTKENRSRHSKARKTSSTQQELLSQTLESHNNKVFDENVTAATSTGYDPCSPNLTNELPHKFTESRKANSSKLWNSIHSRVPKHGARKRQAIKDGVENRHDDSYSKLLAEYKNIQNQLAKLEEPVSTSHEESVLANNEEEEENHQAVEIPLIGLAETNLTSRAAITAGEDGELVAMNVGKGESDVVLGQGDNARVNSARTQDNDDDEISELELRRIALASAAEKAVAQHVRKTQSKSPPSRHKMRPTPERDRQRRKEHYRRLESRTDPRKASAMGVTPVRRLARKQRERLKRQKAREELYHQEEARLSTRRASEHERHGKLQQRTSHLRILALEDNNEQINQFLQLMRASGRSGCPPSPPKHTRSGHVGLASQAGSTDRDIKPTASRDNYEEVAMEIDEDSNRDSPVIYTAPPIEHTFYSGQTLTGIPLDQGPIMTPWMACADASLSAQSLLHQLQVLARQPTAEGAPPSDYRRLTRDPAANDVDFRDMLIGHQRDDATAGELPPQPVATVTAPDACQLTELIRDASASAHPENTLTPPRPATPDAAAATMTQTRSAEEGSCGSEAKPVVITDGEDEDDEAMRAMLLQSLAVKKRGKEEVVEVKLTRSQDRPAGMLKPQNQKQQMKRKLKAKMHKVPKHMPVVIQLGDSSSDSEDGDAVRTSVRVNHSAFLSSLDVFLKRARKSVMHAAPPARIEGAATPPTPQQQQQQAREKSRDAGASPRDLVHPTPDAVSQLPPERIKEYRRLRWQLIKKQMDRRKDGSDGKPSTAASTPQLKPKATKSSSSSSAAEVGLGDAARSSSGKPKATKSSSFSAAEVGLGDAARSLSGKPRAVEDADEEERKSREREAAGRRLQEHRDSMVRERQEAERMRLELIKKKSIVRIAEQKVKKLTQQLDVAEKIARRNKQLIVRLNTQAQEVQKRLDRGAQVENELLHTQSLNGGSGSSGGGGGVVRLLQKSGGSRNITERGRNGSPQMRVAKPALSNSSSPHPVEKSDSRPLTPVAVTTAAQLRTSTPTSGLTCHPSATVQHTTTTTSSSSSSSSYPGKSLPGSLSGGSSSSAPTAEKVRLLRLQKEYLQKIARLQQGMATAASPVAAATPSGLPSPTKVVQRSKVARRKSLLELNASTRPCLSENGESAGEGGKEATKKAAKETGKEAAKETGKEPERKAGKEACGATGEETTRKAGKEGREEARSFEGGSGVTEGATVTMPVGEALARVTQLLMESYERSPLEGAPSAADYSLQGALVPAAAESVDPGVSVDDVWCRRKPVESETMGRLQPYSSALLHFKSYRYSPYFRTKEKRSLTSMSTANKLDCQRTICRFDLLGTCNDDRCGWQHAADYKMTDAEILQDAVSFVPSIANITETTKPEDYPALIDAFLKRTIDVVPGLTLDEQYLLLVSKIREHRGAARNSVVWRPRVWKPSPTVRPAPLPSPPDAAGENDYFKPRYTTTTAAAAVGVGEEGEDTFDTRYFGERQAEEELESAVLENPTDAQLWLKYAYNQLTDATCDVAVRTDRALGVLARGLETNRHSSELWMHYLRIYSKRADCSDIADLYKQATKYAPTYAIWWMWLQQEKNAKEKDAVCVSAISFLLSARVSCDAADPTTAGDDPSMTPEPAVTSDQTPGGAGGMDGSLLPAAGKESMAEGKEGDNPAIAAAMEEEDRTRQRCRPAPAEGVPRLSMEERSHCLLELLLYRVQLHLQIGKSLTAITILQGALQSKVRQSLLVRHLVLTDRVLLWLSYIHLLEMKSLPEQLFDPRNSNPGKIVSKKPFLLPWQPGMLTSSPQTLLALFKEAFRSCSIREDKAASFSMQRPLYRNLIQMEMARNRTKSARSICQRMLEACPCEPDMWLVLAGLAATPGDARRVHDDAIALNPHDARIYHAAARNCIAQGNREDATTYLRRCVCVYFSAEKQVWRKCTGNKLLGQSVSLHTSLVPRESSATDSKETIASQRLYLWLNYSLLLDVEGKEREVREAYESALSAAASTDAVQVTWMHYLSYVLKQATAAEARPLTLKSFARLCDLVHRCLMSVPTSFPLPFTPSRYWTNYGFHNQVVDLFIRGLPEHQVAAAYSKFMEMMPNNATLAVRSVQRAMEERARTATHLCSAALGSNPACLKLVKVAIYIAHKEGNWPEMHKRLWSGLHALPYAATLWKDVMTLLTPP